MHPGERGFDLRVVGVVADHGDAPPAERGRLIDRLCKAAGPRPHTLLSRPPGDIDRRACLREAEDDSFAHAATATGDDRDRVCQLWCHRSASFPSVPLRTPTSMVAYQCSQWRTSSTGLRATGRNFVPRVYATGIIAVCTTC